MKYVRRSLDGIVLSLVLVLGAASTFNCSAIMRPTEVVIQEIQGSASYMVAGTWQPLKLNMKLGPGTILKTDGNSTVDLLFHSSATALRLVPNSSLRLDKLSKEAAGEMLVTETSLTLLTGAVAGTQR